MNLTDKQKLDLSLGFEAGNYDNAYRSEDIDQTLSDRKTLLGTRTDEWFCAYVIGFWASYERHEIPAKHLPEYEEAVDRWGQTMRELGIAIGKDEDEQIER